MTATVASVRAECAVAAAARERHARELEAVAADFAEAGLDDGGEYPGCAGRARARAATLREAAATLRMIARGGPCQHDRQRGEAGSA